MTDALALFDDERPKVETPPPVLYTEASMLDLLRDRYSQKAGNGPRFVCATHVRSHAGFDARRTADFVAMDVWPSKGLQLHGHEIKVSRSDWLRELKDPSKAAEFMQHCDRWWLVAPEGVAKPDELPPGWGLLVPRERAERRWDHRRGYYEVKATRLRVVRSAPALTRPDDMCRSFVAALLRAATSRNAA